MQGKFLLLIMTFLFCLSGCGKKPVKQRLRTLEEGKTIYLNQNNNITVRAKKMTAIDSKRAFNGINLFDKNVQPIQVSVRNENDFPLTVSEQNIALNLINVQDNPLLFVKDETISSVTMAGLTAVGITVGAGCFFGSYLIAILGCFGAYYGGSSIMAFIGFFGVGVSATLPIIVPASAILISDDKAINEQALQNAVGSSLVNQLTVEPHTTKDFVLLVKKEDCKNQFTMTVEHQYANTSFDVMLPENTKKKLRV